MDATPPTDTGLLFGGMITAIKMVGRYVDRVLLTTYPMRRLTIELVIGVVCAGVVGVAYAYTLGVP